MASVFRTSAEAAFSTREVCQIAKVTPRQLQWWDERGIVRPSHGGRRREYQRADVIAVLVTAELRRRGLSLQKSRRVIRWFRSEIERFPGPLSPSQSEWFLITTGKSTCLENQQAEVIAVMKQTRQPLLLVSITDQVKRLNEFIAGARDSQAARRVRKRRSLNGQLPLFS